MSQIIGFKVVTQKKTEIVFPLWLEDRQNKRYVYGIEITKITKNSNVTSNGAKFIAHAKMVVHARMVIDQSMNMALFPKLPRANFDSKISRFITDCKLLMCHTFYKLQ